MEREFLMASRSMVVADPVATCSKHQPIISLGRSGTIHTIKRLGRFWQDLVYMEAAVESGIQS